MDCTTCQGLGIVYIRWPWAFGYHWLSTPCESCGGSGVCQTWKEWVAMVSDEGMGG